MPDPKRSDEFNRGAYLVEGLGHCGACHTPMNAFGANKADRFLQGNQIDNWTAPNITNDPQIGLGKWSADDIVQYLKTGQTRSSHGQRADEGRHREFHLENARRRSQGDRGLSEGARRRGSAAPAPVPATDPQMQIGEAIFVDTCSACHIRAGTGIEHIFPRLAGNVITAQDDPTTLVRIILTGARAASTNAFPTAPAMPSLGYRLTDSEDRRGRHLHPQ